MRWRRLVVVMVLASACQRSSPPEPTPGEGTGPRPPRATAEPRSGEEAGSPAPRTLDDSGEDAEPGEQPPVRMALDPAIADRTWSASSSQGHAEVRQTVLREGKSLRCQSSATLSLPHEEPVVVWTWATCLATRSQFVFVSPDAQRVLVIDPLPSLQPGGWQDVEVATLYAHGVRMKGLRAGAVVRAPRELSEPTPRFVWLGAPEDAPHYVSDGAAVELGTVEGRAVRLAFSGEGFPTAPEENKAFVAAAGMYRYEDAKKTTHFVGTLDEVPDRYRSRAVRVQSQVAVVAGKGSLAGEEDAPPEAPAGPSPAGPVPPASGKAPVAAQGPASAAAPGAPKEAQVPTPKELLDRARQTVDKANATQRQNEALMDSLR